MPDSSPNAVKSVSPLGLEPAKEEIEPHTSGTIDPDAVFIQLGSAADAPPLPISGSRSFKERAIHLWHGLPSAAKATLILAIASTILLIAYSITAVSLSVYDEQAHVSTVIIVMSVFILYAAFDAVIYENTLQLILSIFLTALILARVLWFISTRPIQTTMLPLKIIWGAIIAAVLVAFILTSLLACRQFGWRLYSRLGIDYRQKGAARMQRLALVAHTFNAVVKLDFIFLITVSALGIDVTFENRSSPLGVMLGLTISNFVVATAITVWGVVVASTSDALTQHRRLVVFDIVAPLSFAGPIAMIVYYGTSIVDLANAWLSLVIACSVFMAVRVILWIALHIVIRNTAKMGFVAGRVVVRPVRSKGPSNSDTLLSPLQEGAWLGKPAPRNPHKLRFFQLSHDASTLRWGWRKFVRLYYVQEVISSPETLTLTLTFVLDPELALKFQDVAIMKQWQRGLEHAMVLIMRPDANPVASDDLEDPRGPHHHHDPTSSSRDGSPMVGGRKTAGRKEKAQTEDEHAAHLEEGMLHLLGMNVRRMGKTFSRSRSSGISTGTPTESTRLGSEVSGEAGTPESASRPALTTSASKLRTASAIQLQKRQRMAAFLAAAAATVGRLNPGKSSPGGWLMSRPRPPVEPEDRSALRHDEDELEGDSAAAGKRRRVEMVTVGTQTGDIDLELIATSSAYTSQLPPGDSAATSSGPAENPEEDLAAQYAGLMAAAMAAGDGGGGGGGWGEWPSPAAGGDTADRGALSSQPSPFGFGRPDRTDTTEAAESTPAKNRSSVPRLGFSTPSAAPGSAISGRLRSNLSPPLSPTPSTSASSIAAALRSPTLSRAATPASPTSMTAPLAISVDVIDFDELSMGKLLGAGSEGAVYAAWYLETPVAVKRFNRVEDSLHEVGMYLGVGSHDNVVALRALCQHEGAMHVVLEYCPRGTLDAMLHHSAKQQWDPARLVPLVRSIARGLHHLHSRGIVHRDLKPANIFVGHGQTMKVGDFGMSRYVGHSMGSTASSGPPQLVRLSPGVIGTAQYSAPELINESLRPDVDSDAEWAMKVDVWSFGVTLWEIMERKRPFEGSGSMAVQAMWLNNPYEVRLPPVKVPESLDAAGKRVIRGLSDLVEDCTRVDPLARPTFGAVLRRLRGLSSAGSGAAA